MTQIEIQPDVASGPGGFTLREVSILVALMIPTLMGLISASMLGVALPVIQAEFGVSVDLLALVIAAGFLMRVPLMSVYGRVGDLFGKKQLYLLGLVIIVVGVIVSAFAQTFEVLIVGRILEGFGGAASLPLAMALVVDTLPEERRGRGLGIWNAAAPAGMTLGPVIGGFMIEAFGWRSIFVVAAVGTIFALGVVAFMVPNSVLPTSRPKIDWLGAAAWVVTLAGLLLATSTASIWPFGSFINLIYWAITGLGVIVLIWNALQRPDPFIGFDIIQNRRFMMPSLAIMLRMFTLEGVRFLTILYLANVFLLSPSQIGLFMAFFTVPLFIGVAYGGVLADRWTARAVGMLAMSGMLVSVLWLGWLDSVQLGYWWLAPGLMLSAFFTAICLAAFSKTAVSALGPTSVGLAAGVYNTIRFAGLATSTPLLGMWLAQGFAQYEGLESVAPPYQSAYFIVAILAAVAIGVSALIPVQEDK